MTAGNTQRSSTTNRSGVSSIEIATAATSGPAIAPSKILLSVPNSISTNANSPTCASAKAAIRN